MHVQTCTIVYGLRQGKFIFYVSMFEFTNYMYIYMCTYIFHSAHLFKVCLNSKNAVLISNFCFSTNLIFFSMDFGINQ